MSNPKFSERTPEQEELVRKFQADIPLTSFHGFTEASYPKPVQTCDHIIGCYRDSTRRSFLLDQSADKAIVNDEKTQVFNFCPICGAILEMV